MGLFSRKKKTSESGKDKEIKEHVVISYGSGYLRAAYIDDSDHQNIVARPITLDDEKESMATVLAFCTTEVRYGDSAVKQHVLNMSDTVFNPQRLIGRTLSELERSLYEYPQPKLYENRELLLGFSKLPIYLLDKNEIKLLGNRPAPNYVYRTPTELVALLLEKVKETVEYNLSGTLRKATLVLPPDTDQRQKNAYQFAAQTAGFEVNITFDAVLFMTRQYLTESWELIWPPKKSHLSLYIDLSKNCTNITLLEIKFNAVTQIQTLSDYLLRGDEFTSSLQNHVLRQALRYLRQEKSDISFKSFFELYYYFETQKKWLSLKGATDVSIKSAVLGSEFKATVTQHQYDLYCNPLINYFKDLLKKFFTLTSYEKDQIDDVFFVGASARYASASDAVHDFFSGTTVHIVPNQFVRIAEGASVTRKFTVSSSMRYVESPFKSLAEMYYSHYPLTIEWKPHLNCTITARKTLEMQNMPGQSQKTFQNRAMEDKQRANALFSELQPMQREGGNMQLISESELEQNTSLERNVKGNAQEASKPEPNESETAGHYLQAGKGNMRASLALEPSKSETAGPPLQAYKGNALETSTLVPNGSEMAGSSLKIDKGDMLLAPEPNNKTLDISTLNISTPSTQSLQTTATPKPVGISLGRCNGVVTVERVVVADDEGRLVTPCFVTFDDDEPIVGIYAKYCMVSRPANTFLLLDAISLVGHPFNSSNVQAALKTSSYALVEKDGQAAVQVEINNESEIVSFDEIVTLVVNKLAKLVLSQGPVLNAVVTLSKDWNASTRRTLWNKALQLGLGKITLISETKAIAAAMGRLNFYSAEGTNCLVVDVGGHVLNLVLLQKAEDKMHLTATKSSSELGGDKADELLMQHFLSVFRQQHKKELPADVLPRLRMHCELLKERASADPTKTACAKIHNAAGYTDLDLAMTHTQLGEICKDLFKGIVENITKLLAEANLEKGQIDDLVIIGGGARLSGMKSAVQEFFGGKQATEHLENPEAYMSYGAMVLAEGMK